MQYDITVDEFKEMIASVGWKTYTDEQIEKAIKNSMYIVKIMEAGEIVGFGRVVGDFSLVCIITDICVKPEYQKRGFGLKIVNELKRLIYENVKPGEKMQIELTPVAGKEDFYQRAGFKYKPEKITGMYLWIEK